MLFAIGLCQLLGGILCPVWFMQGLEQLPQYAKANIIARLVAMPCIFIMVQSPEDAAWYVFLYCAPFLASGIYGLIWIAKNVSIDWHLPSRQAVVAVFTDNFMMFATRMAITLYTSAIPILLGHLTDPHTVGLYSLADRMRSAAQAMLSPISQAVFPRISYLAHRQPQQAWTLAKKSIAIITGTGAVIGACLFAAADWLVTLFGGSEYTDAVDILRILSPLPAIIGLNTAFAVQVLLPYGLKRPFYAIIATTCIICCVLIGPLIYWHGAFGAALTALITESISCMLYARTVWTHRRLFTTARVDG